MRVKLLALLIVFAMLVSACSSVSEVDPAEDGGDSKASLFCPEIERKEIDFSVLNDVGHGLFLYSIFRDTANDPELIFDETLQAMFNYLGVGSSNIPGWARDIVDNEIARAEAEGQSPDLSVFSNIYDKLIEDPAYSDLKDPSRSEELLEVLINGVIGALGDPFANYVRADHWKAGYANSSGKFKGFGFMYDFNSNGEIVIQSVVSGSPMERAGVKPGDFFVRVDGKSLENCTRQLFSMTLRGYEKDKVEFNVERQKPGSLEREAFTVEVVRETIKDNDIVTYPGVELPENRGNTADDLPYRCSSTGTGLPCPFNGEDGNPDMLYIKIKKFSPVAADDLRHVLNSVDQTNFKGVVLDMRDNPGGAVTAWIAIADMLMNTDGYIRTSKMTNRSWHEFLSRWYGYNGGKVSISFEEDDMVRARLQGQNKAILRQDLPMTILLNKDSYSASEASAAALQGNGRAIIVSRDARSGGKGTTNIYLELRKGEYGAVYTSIAFFLTPDGEMIEKMDLDDDGYYEVGGLKPDIHIPWSNEDFTKNNRDVNYDPTLFAALEWLKEQLNK